MRSSPTNDVGLAGMRTRVWGKVAGAALLLDLLGCTAAHGTGASRVAPSSSGRQSMIPTASSPLDWAAVRDRESLPLAQRDFAWGPISGRIEASGAIQSQSFENGFSLSVPIGTPARMRCLVYSGPKDPGGTLAGVLSAIADSVDVRRVEVTQIELIADQPSISVRLEYQTRDRSAPSVGELKVMMHDHWAQPVLCLHDQVGYHATFARAARVLVESLSRGRSTTEAVPSSEFRIDRVGTIPIGFRRRVALPSANGTSVLRSLQCTVIPKSPRVLLIEDTTSTEISGRQGEILAAKYARSRNGKLYLDAAVRAIGSNEYVVRGEREGRSFSGRFRTRGGRGLVGEQGTALRIEEAMHRRGPWALRLEQYQPALTPLLATEIVYRTEVAGSHEISVTGPSLRARGSVDEKGRFWSMETMLGSIRMIEERLNVPSEH